MIGPLKARFFQGYRTGKYPQETPRLSDRYVGAPEISAAPCLADCRLCTEQCPTEALARHKKSLSLDMGRCIFCRRCAEACPEKHILFTEEHRMAVRNRKELLVSAGEALHHAEPLENSLRRILGRSLRLRQVSAGGCNACEADTNVLNTLVFDLGRFGIQFVASPRHADGLLVTGPISRNMETALRKTYEAVPDPKIVIAVGACAISGGIYADREETCSGLADILPVDLFVPGCPPNPYTILDGLLRILGRCAPIS